MSLVLKDKKRLIGFKFAWRGLVEVFKEERNFKVHVTITLLVIITGFCVKLSTLEWTIILLVISHVLVAEVFNSVIERVIDYIKPDIHPLARSIKDIAAGSVLIATMFAIVIGAIILLPKIYLFFN